MMWYSEYDVENTFKSNKAEEEKVVLLEHEPKWQKKGERRKHFMHNKNL
jgi:hypothetical protein